MLKLEKKQSEIANVMLQRSEMETILKDKQVLVDSMQKELAAMKEGVR